MIIDCLCTQPAGIRDQAAVLLSDHFDEPSGWPDVQAGRTEVDDVCRDGFLLGAIDDVTLLGLVGGLPEYDGRVWELHPLVVRREARLQGIGRRLVEAFEAEVQRRGGLTMTLGTDDDSGMTSLSGVDLYDDVPGHVAGLRDLGRRHPFLFYRKLGWVVTGVVPDANGRGFPDIYMSKPVPDDDGEA
ncbi:MAG: GNAT family N-acetyltransferase [Acidobacteriota bacterium]